ncbi:MAG TPA: hypothetical protein VNP71_10790 [Thermoplasmata archaeon]|nr:hypothetical protein [Thermoplasmata archaeon]
MRREKPTITELSFFVCGFLVIIVGWLADLLGVFELNTVTGGHSTGTLQLRIFLTMFGVAFATIGVAYDNFPEILSDGEMAKRYLVSFLFLADGSLHLYALNDHLGEAFPAAFFGVFSGLQLAAAFLIPYAHKDLDWAWLGMTAFLIAAYIVTRTVSVWPIGYVEDLDALGVISKVVEVLTVLVLLSLMQSERVARRKTAKVAAVSTR